ncbi:hypothetical protein AtubIFM55763_001767 [Aspergillus tubingensis]|nr:hypothetical protein AtubIFM55763_001767 [Aspergillus tubingensis]
MSSRSSRVPNYIGHFKRLQHHRTPKNAWSRPAWHLPLNHASGQRQAELAVLVLMGGEINHRNDREFRAPAGNSMKSSETNLPGHDRRAVASFKSRRWIFAARSDPPGGQLGRFVSNLTSEHWRQPSLADHPRSPSQRSPRTQDRDVVLSNRLPVPTSWAREYCCNMRLVQIRNQAEPSELIPKYVYEESI